VRREPKPEPYWQALVEVVERVMATRPAGAAALTLDREAWTITIHPRSSGAASVEIGDAGGEEIYLSAGETLSALWGDAERVAAQVEPILEGVVDGRLTQRGRFVIEGRIDTSGDFMSIGQWTFVPWRWLPREIRYAAYD
jgi:hypothetical protein